MKRKPDEQMKLILRYALGVLGIGLLLLCLLLNFGSVKKAVSLIFTALKPVLYALLFVLFVNGPTQAIRHTLEKRLCRKKDRKKFCQILSVILGYLFFLLILAALLVLVILPLINFYSSTVEEIPQHIATAKSWLSDTISSIPILSSRADSIQEHIDTSLDASWDNLVTVAPTIVSWGQRFLSEASSILLGLIISVYILLSLPYLGELRDRMFTALFSPKNAARIHQTFHEAYTVFCDYFAGRLLYSLIVGIVFYIALWLMGVPLYSFVSIMIGVCTFVPVAGTVVGFAIGVFLVFITSSHMVLWFALLYLALLLPGYLFLQKFIIKKNVRPSITESLLAVLVMLAFFGVGGAIVAVPVYLWFKLQWKKLVRFLERRKETRLHQI